MVSGKLYVGEQLLLVTSSTSGFSCNHAEGVRRQVMVSGPEVVEGMGVVGDMRVVGDMGVVGCMAMRGW